MAYRDFKRYFNNVLAQYVEMKQDLKDFEEALQNGYITEDKLSAVKDDIAAVEINYQRLAYIAYLLELPNRKTKTKRVRAQNKDLEDAFTKMKADEDTVEEENKSLLDHLRKELKRLKEDKKTDN